MPPNVVAAGGAQSSRLRNDFGRAVRRLWRGDWTVRPARHGVNLLLVQRKRGFYACSRVNVMQSDQSPAFRGPNRLRLKALLLIALMACLPAATALAKAKECKTNLAGQEFTLEFETTSVEYRSFREHWSPFAPNCPSEAVIARLLPDLTPEARRDYCLISNDKTGAYLAAVVGAGDGFGRCKKMGRVCRAVNGAKEIAAQKIGGVKDTVLASKDAIAAAGLNALENGAGAMVMTGNAGTVAGTLSAGAASAAGFVTAPATLTGAAAGAVVIGGAVLICRE